VPVSVSAVGAARYEGVDVATATPTADEEAEWSAGAAGASDSIAWGFYRMLSLAGPRFAPAPTAAESMRQCGSITLSRMPLGASNERAGNGPLVAVEQGLEALHL